MNTDRLSASRLAALAVAILMASCQTAPSTTVAPIASLPAVEMAPSVQTDTATTTSQPDLGHPTALPEPSTMPTATPQPFIADGGALPEGARMRIGIGMIHAAASSPDGIMLAVGADTGIYVYRVDGLERIWRRYTEYPVETVAWSPDGRRLLTGTQFDGSSILWDASNGLKLLDLGGWRSAAWSPDGTQVGVAARPGDVLRGLSRSVLIRDTSTGAILRVFDVPDEDAEYKVVFALAWSHDGRNIAGGTLNGIYIWDTITGAATHKPLNSPLFERGSEIGFSPDGKLFRFAGRLWDVETGNLFMEVALEREPDDVTWSPDGLHIAALDWGDLVVADIHSRKTDYAYSGTAHHVAWSPDGEYLALVSSERITILDAASGQPVREMIGDGYSDINYGPEADIVWLPDSRRAITYSSQNLVLWDMQTGVVLQGFSTSPDVSDIAWLPDTTTLTLSSPDGYQFWDANSGTMLSSSPAGFDPNTLPFSEKFPSSMLSPHENLIIEQEPLGDGGCGDGPFGGGCFRGSHHITVKNVATGRIIFGADYAGGVGSLAWSSDATLLAMGLARVRGSEVGATGAYGSDVIVIDVAAGQQIATFSGHLGNVVGLAWSSNGYWLASTSTDATVIVWNVPR